MKTKSILIMALAALSLTSCYDFNREQAEKDAESQGKQVLYEAEYSKQAKVEQAKADFESAKLEAETKQVIADADAKVTVTNAEAKAESIEIISKALRGNEVYLKYLMLIGMNASDNRIYIPTEAGLPILEAKP